MWHHKFWLDVVKVRTNGSSETESEAPPGRTYTQTPREGSSVPPDAFVDLLVFQQVCFLSERLRARVAPERFLPRVRPQMYLDVALVEEPPVADAAPVHRLLLPQQPETLLRGEDGGGGGLLLLLLRPAARLLGRVRGRGGGVGVVLTQRVVVDAVEAVLGHESPVDC